jgi:hypothetical protein
LQDESLRSHKSSDFNTGLQVRIVQTQHYAEFRRAAEPTANDDVPVPPRGPDRAAEASDLHPHAVFIVAQLSVHTNRFELIKNNARNRQDDAKKTPG